jgi:kynurenine formamidase
VKHPILAALATVFCTVLTPAFAADGNSVTLAEALKVIQSKELVDLTHRFSPSTPVWGGFGQATMTAACDPKTYRPYTIDHDGFRTTFYSLVGQYGTHVDPPAHFRSDGLTMDEIPLKDMILPLVVIDITPLLAKDPNHALSVDDIKAWETAHGRIAVGRAILRTREAEERGRVRCCETWL